MSFGVFAALIIQLGFSAVQTQLEGGLRGESNAFFRDREKVADFALYLKPEIALSRETKNTSAAFSLATDFSKYASNDSLDYFDYGMQGDLVLNKNGKWIWNGGVNYFFETEPPDDQGMKRLEKVEAEPYLEITYKKSEVKQHKLRGYAKQTTFNFDTLEYANNMKMGGTYTYQYYFLPETAFIFTMDGEYSVYPDGLINQKVDPGSTRYLYDNMLMQARAGINGRLTEHTTVNLLFGYASRSYKKGSNYNEPVFEVSFHEQITPQDILMAGYLYRVYDSFYTNYEINQHMYLGYSRVFGDRFIVYFRADYIYRSYSLPNRREDQRLNGTIRVDISYKPNWIIQAGVNGDFLVSDVINQTSALVVDPATSYQALQVFVGSKLTF
jgi:hypothetical protein